MDDHSLRIGQALTKFVTHLFDRNPERDENIGTILFQNFPNQPVLSQLTEEPTPTSTPKCSKTIISKAPSKAPQILLHKIPIFSEKLSQDCSCEVVAQMEAYKPPEREYKSKNLLAERARRTKLNDRLYKLRALVPNITKMSKETILADAADYIKELENQVQKLQEELLVIPDEDESKEEYITSVDAAEAGLKDNEVQVEVEVTPVDANKIVIKIISEKKEGGFIELMEVISNLGLEVTNINVGSFGGYVSNVIWIEGKDVRMVYGINLRERLLKVIKSSKF